LDAQNPFPHRAQYGLRKAMLIRCRAIF
jgi:hypothetical protein